MLYLKIYLKTGDGGLFNKCKKIINNKKYNLGGVGGDSGNIYLYNIKTLNFNNVNYKKSFVIKNGENGMCFKKKGKNSRDLILVFNKLNLKFNKINIFLKGGLNLNFKKNLSYINLGKNKILKLNYKFFTDILLLGYYNSGKSSFLSNIFHKNNIKINNYNFTTNKYKKYIINFLFKIKLIIYDTIGFTKKINIFNFISRFNIIFNIFDISLLKFNIKKFFIDFKNINKFIYKTNFNYYYKSKWYLFNKYDLIKLKKFNIYIKFFFLINNWFYLYFILSLNKRFICLSLLILYLKLKREWRNRYTYQI